MLAMVELLMNTPWLSKDKRSVNVVKRQALCLCFVVARNCSTHKHVLIRMQYNNTITINQKESSL